MGLFDSAGAFALGGAGGLGLSKLLGMGAKDGQQDANLFSDPKATENSTNSINNLMQYQGNPDALNGVQGSRTATDEVQNNSILGGLFGKGGQLEQTEQNATDLANKGFSLQPEDHEAYGQGLGNITRQFDSSDNNLAQALSNRGLSSSGVAAQQFAGSNGNKNEQLAQLQMNIAQQRMQTNMQRLKDTRQFMSQLGQQGQNAIQDQYGRQLAGEKQNFGEQQGKADTGMNYLQNEQDQANNQFAMQQSTKRGTFGDALMKGALGAAQAAPGTAMQAGVKGAMA